jgi:DNA-binding transcriptional ArsR family regulator
MRRKGSGASNTISATVARLAIIVGYGGEFYDADLCLRLGGITQPTLVAALRALREAGALSFGDAKLGRTRAPRSISIIKECSFWDEIGLRTFVGGTK